MNPPRYRLRSEYAPDVAEIMLCKWQGADEAERRTMYLAAIYELCCALPLKTLEAYLRRKEMELGA